MLTTRKQLEALQRLRDRGPEAWRGGVSRNGGSVRRMINHLVNDGLLTPAPQQLTAAGSAALCEAEGRFLVDRRRRGTR